MSEWPVLCPSCKKPMRYGYLSEEGLEIWYCVNRECLDVLVVEPERSAPRPNHGEIWLVTTRGVLVKFQGRDLKRGLGRLGALLRELKKLNFSEVETLFEKYEIEVR